MTVFIATLRIKPGHEAEFERLQRELSLSYPTLPQKIKLFHLDRRGTSTRQRA